MKGSAANCLRWSPGGVLAIMAAVFLGTGRPAVALTPLDPSSPASFFTSLADNFLRDLPVSHPGLYPPGLCITNIPVYPTNYYTPSVHRLLQLAANIYDASTNRYFEVASGGTNGPPFSSVFRPTFGVQETNIFINGYVEVPPLNVDSSCLIRPLALPNDLAQIIAQGGVTNIYGIPYVLGARKGFPNFNEFSYQTISQITRHLEINKVAVGTPRSQWLTNQMYQVGVSNIIGLEVWNSYSNAYPRDVNIIMADDLRMCLTVTNTGSPTVVFTTNVAVPAPGAFVVGTNYVITADNWLGFSNSISPSANALSFQTLRTNVFFIPDLAYVRSISQLVSTNSSAAWEPIPFVGNPMPHFVLTVTNQLRFLMIDPATSRLIDYVQLSPAIEVTDLTAELTAGNNDANLHVWDTNFTANSGIPVGINNQLLVSIGAAPVSSSQWNDATGQQLSPGTMNAAISAFSTFYNSPANGTPLVAVAPFAPTSKYSQAWTFQADDPLVHYMLSDLNDPSALQGATNHIVPPNNPTFLSSNAPLPNIGVVNNRYHPWNYYPNQTTDPGFNNLAIKDPLAVNSDAWSFPNAQPFRASWLGQVHRGTPWQTVYLKSAPIDTNTWVSWTGNANLADSIVSMPTNDWHLAGLFAWLLNTNKLASLLPVNQITVNTWSSTFSNGIVVLTNNVAAPGELDPLVMNSSSPQLAFIINGINNTRSTQPGGYFLDVGDILATPELSLNSPWLDTNDSTFISDAAYEAIPSQILASLSRDSIGSVIQTNGVPLVQFTGYDGSNYTIQASSDLVHWSQIGTATPTNGAFTVSDPAAPVISPRYYRTMLSP